MKREWKAEKEQQKKENKTFADKENKSKDKILRNQNAKQLVFHFF